MLLFSSQLTFPLLLFLSKGMTLHIKRTLSDKSSRQYNNHIVSFFSQLTFLFSYSQLEYDIKFYKFQIYI